MTENHRFITYTRLEKAYLRILSRRTRPKRGKRLLQYHELADAVDGSAWIGKERSDRLTPLRLMIIGGRANARPIRHLAYGLERITA
jgi:hypothetical protein